VPGDIGPAVPQRPRSLDEVLVVAAGVTPASFGRMSRGAVEFHAHPVLLVQVVQVTDTAAMPAPGLPPRHGQPVGPFHAADVPVLERGVDAVGGVLERSGDPAAPPHPRAPGERLAEQSGRGQPAAHSGRDPAVSVVEAPRAGDQVQHGVLHRRPRQLPRHLPLRHQPPPPVDRHPPDRLPRWTTFSGHADVDLCGWFVHQPMKFGRRLMAEGCPRSGAQHAGPELRFPRQRSGERRVHPTVQALPLSRAKSSLDDVLPETGIQGLLS
jgi:hypothetical protein